MNKPNWVITGISSGFGAALAEAMLAAGGKVVEKVYFIHQRS